MFSAVLTTFFFALSVILARRSITHIGSQRANFARLLVALILLGLWAHLFGQGLGGATFGLFFISGVIGLGLGDVGTFEALPRIGPGLTALLCQCLAAPIAAVTEWLWLDTRLSPIQLGSSALILAGVALALAPGAKDKIPSGHRAAGIAFGVMAAAGQAWGAVLSRFAFERAHATGIQIDGMTSAYQRTLGGVLSIGLVIILSEAHRRWRTREKPAIAWKKAWPWVLGNAVAGPTLGVSCYQWSLKQAPSSIVLPIVATTPLAAMLLAFLTEGIRPTRRAMVGSILAVAGVIVLVRNA